MHTKSMSDHEGDFRKPEAERYPCPLCKDTTVQCTPWDSDCGGYTDYKYECTTKGCTYKYWVEGPDA